MQDNNIEYFNRYLRLISTEVDTINDENMIDKLKVVRSYTKQIDLKKKHLKKNTSSEEYHYICDVVHKGIKQISTSIDSIIEKKKEEQKVISSELSKIVTKKKLINYQR